MGCRKKKWRGGGGGWFASCYLLSFHLTHSTLDYFLAWLAYEVATSANYKRPGAS